MFKQITVKGSYYEMGYQLGEFFKESINNHIDRFITMLKDNKIKESLEIAKNNVKNSLPSCYEELRGKADGAKVDFDCLFLMHYPEIYTAPYSCTTVVYKKDNQILFSHNEDEADYRHDDMAIVKYEYEDYYIVALTLYDRLAGCCFAYNSNGFAFSCNYLFHDDERHDYLSRYVVSRNIIESNSLDIIEEKINKYYSIQPFSLNVIDLNNNIVFNDEIEFNQIYKTIINDKYSRSNHFLTKNNSKRSNSSNDRYLYSKERMDNLKENPSIEDLIDVLHYESNNHDECIFMDPSKYTKIDDFITVSNFSIDTKNKLIIITDYFDKTILKINY